MAQPNKQPARKPGPAPAPRTPIADELRDSIRAWIASGKSVYELAQSSGVDSCVIARYIDPKRTDRKNLRLATLEALAVPLQLRLIQVAERVARPRK